MEILNLKRYVRYLYCSIMEIYRISRYKSGIDHARYLPLSKYRGIHRNGNCIPLRRRRRPRKRPLILFVPDNDTICAMFVPVIRELARDPLVDVVIGFFARKGHENAPKIFADTLAQNITSVGDVNCLKLARLNPDVLVVGNDWGITNILFIWLCRRLHTLSVCIQESVIDFHYKYQKMRHADFVFLQGKQSAHHLDDRKGIFITGNPRYEPYKALPQPSQQCVLINVNFTYGIQEQARDGWLQSVVAACEQSAVDFHISQHPRDISDLKNYGERVIASNVRTIRQQLEDHTLVISRFSSLLQEALLLGRKAIYYNPHGERMQYDFTPENTIFFYATSSAQLAEFLQQALHTPFDHDALNAYRSRHLHTDGESPARCIAEKLLDIAGITNTD